MVQDKAILTMADQQKVVYDLSNGAIFNDLERPLPPVSRSRHSLTRNITETVRHYSHSFNEILIGTYTRPTQQCHFECSWVTEWLSKIFNDTKRRAVSLRQLSFLLSNQIKFVWTTEILSALAEVYTLWVLCSLHIYWFMYSVNGTARLCQRVWSACSAAQHYSVDSAVSSSERATAAAPVHRAGRRRRQHSDGEAPPRPTWRGINHTVLDHDDDDNDDDADNDWNVQCMRRSTEVALYTHRTWSWTSHVTLTSSSYRPILLHRPRFSVL